MKSQEKPKVPEGDYLMSEKEMDLMQDKSMDVRSNLEIWKGQGYDVKMEPTSDPELYRITITDPKTGELVFFEDEELMKRISVKAKESQAN